MDGQAYLELIEGRLQRFFDKKPPEQESLPLALVAELHAADEGYFLLPSIKTYSVQHDEYLYAQIFTEPLTMACVEPYLELLRGRMQALKTTTEHMSSLFALVIICEGGVDAALQKQLEAYKYHRDYCFSLKGWSDLALFVVDLPNNKVSCNRAGRKTLDYFKISSSN